MKVFKLLVIILLVGGFGFAQSVDPADVPTGTVYITRLQNSGLMPGNGGSQNWDFSGVVATANDSIVFGPAAGTPGAGSYPGSAMVSNWSVLYEMPNLPSQFSMPVLPASLFYLGYYNIDAQGLKYDGSFITSGSYALDAYMLSTADQPIPVQPTELVVPLPLTPTYAGDTTTYKQFVKMHRTKPGTTINDSVGILRTYTRMITVDGSGSLTLPNAFFNSTIRLKTVSQEIDSLFVYLANGDTDVYTMASQTTRYSWYDAAGSAWEILTIMQNSNNETVQAYMRNAANTLTPILNMSQNQYVVSENSGVTPFNMTLSLPSNLPISVNYTTTSASLSNPATAGTDFMTTSGTVTFAPGETTKTLHIPILEDLNIEGDENFNIVLSNLTGNAVFGTNGGSLVVIDDNDRPWVRFSTQDTFVFENQPVVFAHLIVERAINEPITVQFHTEDRTAIAGTDYVGNATEFTIPANTTVTPLPVALINDILLEGTRSFTLKIDNISGNAYQNMPDTCRFNIYDDDFKPNVRMLMPDTLLREATNIAGNYASVWVELSVPDELELVVGYHTEAISAIPNVDYEEVVDKNLIFTPGQVLKRLDVKVYNDLIKESMEEFKIVLHGVSANGQLLQDSIFTVFIVDNEPLGIDSNLDNAVSIYPNPTNGPVVFATRNSTILSVTLSDMAGKTIQHTDSATPLQLNNLPNGVYNVQIETTQGKVVKKIVLNK